MTCVDEMRAYVEKLDAFIKDAEDKARHHREKAHDAEQLLVQRQSRRETIIRAIAIMEEVA